MQIFHSLTDPQLVKLLEAGGVGVLPTDTVYGLVARAVSPIAVKRLYALKRREHKPGTVIAANVEQLIEMGIDLATADSLRRFWPAPLSIVLPLDADLEYLHQGRNEAPFRVVDNENVRMLLEQTGPLLTSSANQPGEPPASSLIEAQAYFDESIDFYVDGGDLSDRQPSTIARFTDDGLEVLRMGAAQVTKKEQA